MGAAATGVVDFTAGRLVLAVLCLLYTVAMLADDEPISKPPAGYDEALEQEILENAERWRVPEEESQWRAPPPRQEGRMTIGFDSVYEEARGQTDSPAVDRIGDRQTKPSSIFRLDF